MVHNAIVLVSKWPKTKNICNWFVIIISNQVGPCRCTIWEAWISRYLLEERLNRGLKQNCCLWCWWGYDWDMQWGDLEELGGRTLDVMLMPFYVALCYGRTWVEIPENESFRYIWALFKKALSCCFQYSGDFRIAQKLVFKFDSVGPRPHPVHKHSNVDTWVDIGFHWEGLWGTTYTGARFWQGRHSSQTWVGP